MKPVNLIVALCLSLSTAALAKTPSNMLPTSAIVANFQVARSAKDPTQVKADAWLTHFFVKDGKLAAEELEISNDDVITFSSGSTSVRYEVNAPSMLPFAAGATYAVRFVRATGESFENQAVMPGDFKFATPEYDHVFKKSEEVVASWDRAENANGTMIMTSYNCETLGGAIKFNKDFTRMTIAAGVANACEKDVRIEMLIAYMNAGDGYGSFVAGNMVQNRFFIGAGRSTGAPALENLRLAELLEQTRASGSPLIHKLIK